MDEIVWNLLDQETRKFLLFLAVPAEITPELCRRLTGQDIIASLMKKNIFLSQISGYEDTFRFHDIFRDFLLEHVKGVLSADEIRQVNKTTAEWYFEKGDFFMSTRYYYENRDHEGINRCAWSNDLYHEDSECISVEENYHFSNQFTLELPLSFIKNNMRLIGECAYVSYLDGNQADFFHYKDMLAKMMPQILEKDPKFLETAGFINSLDYRIPIVKYAKHLTGMMMVMWRDSAENVARANTITQNLPLFHRSMRDFSEIYQLREDDLKLLRDTFGVIIGGDYEIMEQSLIAGIYYEKGDLIKAAYHAMAGYLACKEELHPETLFSSHMILSVVLYGMGADNEAGAVMKKTEAMIEEKALFLRPNFKAYQTIRAIRVGEIDSGAKWLEIYGGSGDHLRFYQIYRYFTTMRAYIALRDFSAAVLFGRQLLTLASEYNRPLDQIESGLLLAMALWGLDNKDEGAKQLRQAVCEAMPYGFAQLFVNEGKEILPILLYLTETPEEPAGFRGWVSKLTGLVLQKHHPGFLEVGDIKLSKQQLLMLRYLAQGKSYEGIAEAAGLKRTTIKSHIMNLYKRLGVHNAEEAIVKGKIMGVLD